jgi:hypothetical protein
MIPPLAPPALLALGAADDVEGATLAALVGAVLADGDVVAPPQAAKSGNRMTAASMKPVRGRIRRLAMGRPPPRIGSG